MITIIARHPRFSPNSEARDAALFRAIVMNFALQGVNVTTLDEAVFENRPPQFADSPLILSMARSEAALIALTQAEKSGATILNSPSALQNARRTDFQRWFAAAESAAPHWHISQLTPQLLPTLPYPLWWKRNTTATTAADDVQFSENPAQLSALLAQHPDEDALVMEHIVGQLVKFYGVSGTKFFHCAAHQPNSFSKFGHEAHNHCEASEANAPISSATLRSLHAAASDVAQQSGFTIYGGDGIIRADGSFVFIDFNDFPSFSPCQPEAAAAIVERSLNLLQKSQQ